jgi:hypothetical protein
LQCSAVWGFQTEHAYSSFGRTRDRYACDFIFVLEVLRFLFKNSTSTRRRTRSQETSGSLCSKLEVFIWRHVVYVPKLSTTFHGILICVIFRPTDMQEYYMLFGIFARDVGLYFLSVFYIAWADFQYTTVYLFCVLHTYHCVHFYKGVSWNSHL